MRSQFLVLLLVGTLQSLSLVCGAAAQAPAEVPADDTVEIKFDRFRNRTTVRFPSTQQTVVRANNSLTPTWLASFEGQTPSTLPSSLSLTFVKVVRTWEYLHCYSVAILADGSRVQLPPENHSGHIGRGYLIERINVVVGFDIARKLSESQLVEFKVCNTEGRFSQKDLQGLRGVIKAITPKED